MEYLLLESHFGVSNNSIRPNTRNVCSNELVSIIYKVAEIICPDEKIEILLLPSEMGSYKDILKISGHLGQIAAIITLVYTVLGYYKDSDKNELEVANSCIEYIKNINNLSGNEIYISNEKFEKICENYGIINSKNRRYEILEKDETIEYEETIIKNGLENDSIIISNRIERVNFHNMITKLPEDDSFEGDNYEGIFELITLVVKQKKEGKGIPWKGIYYGDDIIYHGVKILSSEDEISFYMQDETFKQKIKNKEIEFKNGDNMKVIFGIKTDISNGNTKNMNVYVKEVKSFNEEEIIHKIKTNNLHKNDQLQLF